MNNTITVRIKDVYGEEKLYPVCRNAKLFASLAGTKTITKRSLLIIEELGFNVVIEARDVERGDWAIQHDE